MKEILAIIGALFALCSPAFAEVVSVRVCADKTLTASSTTDCTDNANGPKGYTDISRFKYFSYQVYCTETTGDSMSINIDWIGGSAGGSAYMAVPLLSTGAAMSQLRTAYATEGSWSTLMSIQPPVSPVGTIRLTENNADADIVCTVILNMGD